MEVKDYYNKIANDYDDSRFNNTYGRYIDSQERALISTVLKSQKLVLNLGCGTGRFMEYCSHGSDFSEEMLQNGDIVHAAGTKLIQISRREQFTGSTTI